jgi:ribosomal protein L28
VPAFRLRFARVEQLTVIKTKAADNYSRSNQNKTRFVLSPPLLKHEVVLSPSP